MTRPRLTLLLMTACAVLPAFASGSPMPNGSVTFAPAKRSAGAHLKVAARGTDAGFRRGEIPNALSIAFQKGFTLKPAAVPGTCTEDKAMDEACPADSVLGSGSIEVLLSGARYTAGLHFYRAPSGVIFYFKEKESGFNGASTGAVRAASDPAYGRVLAFDKLPLPALPPGLDLRLDRLTLDLGTSGKKGKCTKYKGKGSKRRCVKRAKPPGSFIVNPAECTGTWGVQLRWGYRKGEELREGAAPCQAAGQTPPPR